MIKLCGLVSCENSPHYSSFTSHIGQLDLLGAPALVGLAHVRGGLDRGNEFQSQVADTDETDKRTGNVAQDVTVQHDRSDEDVDCNRLVGYERRE